MAILREETLSQENKVWVSVERTVNLGNYENIRIMAGGSRTVGPEEDYLDLRKQMMEEVLDEVDNRAEEYK